MASTTLERNRLFEFEPNDNLRPSGWQSFLTDRLAEPETELPPIQVSLSSGVPPIQRQAQIEFPYPNVSPQFIPLASEIQSEQLHHFSLRPFRGKKHRILNPIFRAYFNHLLGGTLADAIFDRLDTLNEDIADDDETPLQEMSVLGFLLFLSRHTELGRPAIGSTSDGCLEAYWPNNSGNKISLVFIGPSYVRFAFIIPGDPRDFQFAGGGSHERVSGIIAAIL